MAITRSVTDPSGIAASRVAAVASMIREVEHFKALKKLLEKAQDQFFELICANDPVQAAYVTLEEAQDLVLNRKSEKESSLDNEQATLRQLMNASDVSPAMKHELYVCIQNLRAYRAKCAKEEYLESFGGNQSGEDSDSPFDNKNDKTNN
ncbi:hypothetical protein BDFG_08379 [Blastomyces dermatitidis ATCC 26199]|nr:hypothetical protein BDFG_08379 [Blastomyces dermatitidis ATCC 26199]